ncbi:MAG TPA: DUF6804 family protein [Amnibacterium sp.]|jgi:hypothetical protein|nr:DUF6804 family protein [Amnibacterium sp.]
MSGNRAERRAAGQGAGPERGGSADRYGRRPERRALAPAVLAAILLLAGLALLGSDAFLWIRYAVAILSLIVAVFVVQARRWPWLPGPVVIAVLWNPAIPFPFAGKAWALGQLVAAAALVLTGVFASRRAATR